MDIFKLKYGQFSCSGKEHNHYYGGQRSYFFILGTSEIACCIIAINNFPSRGNDKERVIKEYQSDDN